MPSSLSDITPKLRAYSPTAVVLHWTSSVAFLGMLSLGWYMTWIEDQPGSAWYFDLHKSLGLLVGVLIVLRLLWRATHRPDPYPSSMARWQISAAKASHGLLYLSMLAMPLLGLAGADLSPDGLVVFGHAMSQPLGGHKFASELFFGLHSAAAWVLVSLIVVHASAAMLHLHVYRDGVFERMWLRRKRRS